VDDAVVHLLAGRLAERKAIGRAPRDGGQDFSTAVELVMWFTGSVRQTEAYLGYLTVVTEDILAIRRVWTGVEAVTAALLAGPPTISGAAAKRIAGPDFDRIGPRGHRA
jgi:hypothetical protein